MDIENRHLANTIAVIFQSTIINGCQNEDEKQDSYIVSKYPSAGYTLSTKRQMITFHQRTR